MEQKFEKNEVLNDLVADSNIKDKLDEFVENTRQTAIDVLIARGIENPTEEQIKNAHKLLLEIALNGGL